MGRKIGFKTTWLRAQEVNLITFLLVIINLEDKFNYMMVKY